MASRLAIAFTSASLLWAAAPAPAVAQAAAGPSANATAGQRAELARATNRARVNVSQAVSRRNAVRADKAKLARSYQTQLAEIDRLKQQRASWRRDRLIRNRMSGSLDTAKKLAAFDKRIRQLDGQIRRARRELVVAIDRELRAKPAAARRSSLVSWRRALERSLRPGAKKIVLPDDRIDPLADPEELDYQASLIRQSEEDLAREIEKLEKQGERYEHMAALRKYRRRATELSSFDDDRPRRSPGQRGRAAPGETADSDNSGSPAPGIPTDGTPDTGSPPPEGNRGDGGGLAAIAEQSDLDVVLADVVDGPTIDALRAAEASSDPSVKARVTGRALKQVKARLERLKKRRKLIQKRARSLRRR